MWLRSIRIDPKHLVQKNATALGRFKHENAELTIASNAMLWSIFGDDERPASFCIVLCLSIVF